MQKPNSPENPLWISPVLEPPKLSRLFIGVAFSVMPIAVAILMQRPALRKSLQMRTIHYTKITLHNVADNCIRAELWLNTQYQRACM